MRRGSGARPRSRERSFGCSFRFAPLPPDRGSWRVAARMRALGLRQFGARRSRRNLSIGQNQWGGSKSAKRRTRHIGERPDKGGQSARCVTARDDIKPGTPSSDASISQSTTRICASCSSAPASSAALVNTQLMVGAGAVLGDRPGVLDLRQAAELARVLAQEPDQFLDQARAAAPACADRNRRASPRRHNAARATCSRPRKCGGSGARIGCWRANDRAAPGSTDRAP